MNHGWLVKRLEKIGDILFLLLAFALPLSISAAQFLLALLIGLRIALFASGAKLRILDSPWAGIFIILYFVSSTLSALLSPIDMQSCLKKLASLWIVLLFFVAQEQVKDEQQIVRTFKFLILGATIASLYGIYQHFFCAHPLAIGAKGKVREIEGYCNAIGFFDHHLTYGTQMMMVALLGIGVILKENVKNRTAYLGGVALVFLGLVFSYARGPWLGFAVALIVFLWSWSKRMTIVFGLVFFIATIAVVSVSPSLIERAEAAFSSPANVDRIALWRTTIEMIKDYPLFGVGPGAYRRAIIPYRKDYNVGFFSGAHAHHNLLQELAERGIVGTIFLVAFWFTIFYTGVLRFKLCRESKKLLYLAMMVSLFSLWVSGMFQYNLGDAENAMLAYLLCGLITGWRDSDDTKSG